MSPPARPLGPMEEALVLTSRAFPTGLVAVVRFHRGPAASALAQALAVVQHREPMLRVRVRDRKAGPLLEVAADCPPIPLLRSDRDDWQDLVRDRINEPVRDDEPPLLRAFYITQDGETVSDLVIHAHHAIADGTAVASIVVRALRLIASGNDLAVPSRRQDEDADLPPPADALAPNASRTLRKAASLSRFSLAQLSGEIRHRWFALNTRKPPLQPQSPCLVTSRLLSGSETTDFVQRGRRLGLTVNSLLSAALLRTTYRRLYGPRPTPMRHIGWADLRVYLDPSLRSEVLGCYVSMLRHDIVVFPEDGLEDLAARLQDDVVQAFARGDKWSSLLASRTLMRFLIRKGTQRMGTTALSYLGVPSVPAEIGPFRVREMHAFVPTNRLGPELAAMAHLDFGRLVVDFMTMEADMDQHSLEQLADQALDELRSIGASTDQDPSSS